MMLLAILGIVVSLGLALLMGVHAWQEYDPEKRYRDTAAAALAAFYLFWCILFLAGAAAIGDYLIGSEVNTLDTHIVEMK